jgi:hypothetical protein
VALRRHREVEAADDHMAPSITSTLLWAMATRVSTQTGMPALLR